MLNANPVTEDMIRDMAREARSGIRRIFLHWTGGHYGHNEDAYHICIDRDGTVYLNCKSFLSFKAHTWMHNVGAIRSEEHTSELQSRSVSRMPSSA